MTLANPGRTRVAEELANAVNSVEEPEVIYGIFNDPAFLEPMFAEGKLHLVLREKLLDEALWTTPDASAAKRYMLWTNEQRTELGTIRQFGATILRTRTLTPWRSLQGAETDAIDEGRRAYGGR